MKMLEGESFLWKDDEFQITCRDEDTFIIKNAATGEKRMVSKSTLDDAFLKLEIREVSLDQALEHSMSLVDLPPHDPNVPVIKYRKHYVSSLCRTPLSVEGQQERLAELAKLAGHRRVPGPSTVRRWLSRYIAMGDLGLADRRRWKSTACAGMRQ